MTKLLEMYSIAFCENVTILCENTCDAKSMSARPPSGDCYIGINPLKLESRADELVALAHELGHCETGSFYNKYALLDIRAKHERRADKWAIKKLVPRDELINALSKGYIEIYELAEYFEVTEDFMRKALEFYEMM